MALTLQTLLPPTRSGRTFYVASTLLGIGALLQLILMGVFLIRAGGVARQPAAPVISFAETYQPPMPVADLPAPTQIAAPTPAPPAAPAETLAPAVATEGLTRPTPAPAAPEATSGGLIDEARQLRQRGDMPSALAKLRQAQVSSPDNPQIIAEMALTYEGLGLGDRAAEQWQRIYGMGDSIGALYYLADARLHAAPAAPAPAVAPTATTGSGSGLAEQENTVLKITDIQLNEMTDDPSAAQKMVLKIVVKDRPGSAIDPRKVRILTYFYDLIDGTSEVLTNAQTAYAWLSEEPIDWANDKSEILETTYLRLKDAPESLAPAVAPTPAAHASRHVGRNKKVDADGVTPAPSATPATVRTYLGYVVRLYYDRELQDVKADPIRLLQKFPAPGTLPPE